MDISEIATIRLANQHLLATKYKTPYEVVSWMGAIQAQDFNMAKWAIGVRLPGVTEAQIEDAFIKGDFVRIHIMRPTWHFVSKDDVHWMRELSVPRLKPIMLAKDKALGITDALILKTNSKISKALIKKSLTRQEIGELLACEKIVLNNEQLNHIILHAELDGVVCHCSSPTGNLRQPAYCLLGEKVPEIVRYSQEESIQRLAHKYFSSHGPATIQDFIWWSGLAAVDVRKAINYIRYEFIFETIGSQVYIFKDPHLNNGLEEDILHFLPSYDELLVSYKDKKEILIPEHHKKVIVSQGVFKPTIVKNGKIIGTWRKAFNRDRSASIMVSEYFNPSDEQHKMHNKAFSSMANFFQ